MSLAPRRPLEPSRMGAKVPVQHKPLAKATGTAPAVVSNCAKCQAVLDPKSAFCDECGEPIKQGLKPRRSRAEVKRGFERGKNTRQIDAARNTLKWVGVFKMIVGVIFFFNAYSSFKQIMALGEQNGIDVDLDALKLYLKYVQISIVVGYILSSVIFLGLYFWAKTRPLPATISGLVVFVSLQIASIILNPAFAFKPIGWIARFMIVGALAKGIKSAAYEQKMNELERKREAAAAGTELDVETALE